ncbi:MAG: hypothetical protein DRO96_01100 [Candidatus Aenigmatarchaeota archaeon]|nr:MAG: hypothetical protein DRO96_01100 [Candidatus Aenigmarchaeota archaeon]
MVNTDEKCCLICKKWYTPVLERGHPDMLIQEEFPDAQLWEREQHISGICSDACWKKAFTF